MTAYHSSKGEYSCERKKKSPIQITSVGWCGWVMCVCVIKGAIVKEGVITYLD